MIIKQCVAPIVMAKQAVRIRLVASGTMEEYVYRRQVIKTIAMHVVDRST